MTSFLIMLTISGVWLILIIAWYLVIKPVLLCLVFIIAKILEKIVEFGHVTYNLISSKHQIRQNKKYKEKAKADPDKHFVIHMSIAQQIKMINRSIENGL